MNVSNSSGKFRQYSINIFRQGVWVIKGILMFPALLAGASVHAGFVCDDISGEQAHSPLATKSGNVCFVKQPVPDSDAKNPVNADWVALYFIPHDDRPVAAEGPGLLYDDTPGDIVDAFLMDVDQSGHDKVVVIQSVEIRYSLAEPNSSGKFYSVSVFDQDGKTLIPDEKSSDWFGSGYGWLTDGKERIYEFPYQTQEAARQALRSPFLLLKNQDGSVPVRTRRKTHLYEWPDVRDKTKKYLIAGDRALVDRYSAGWCRATYRGRKEILRIWLLCDALDVDDNRRNQSDQ